MICKNCGNEMGDLSVCNACGYDPTKDDPNVAKNEEEVKVATPVEATPKNDEIVLKKRVNIPSIIGFVCSLLMWIPIPFLTWITMPTFYIAALVLTIIGFIKVKSCRSGKVFSIISLILCILLPLLIIAGIILLVSLYGVAIFATLATSYAEVASYY